MVTCPALLRLLALVVAPVLAGGCSGVAFEGGDCGGVYDGGCAPTMDELAARWPGEVVRIDLQCALASCDRLAGAGSALVTLRDKRTMIVAWSYAGTPLPEPRCVELDSFLCGTAFEAFSQGLPPMPAIASATMTCAGECAWSGGDTTVDMVYQDGSTARMGYGWDAGFPLPSGYSSLPSIGAGAGGGTAPGPSTP